MPHRFLALVIFAALAAPLRPAAAEPPPNYSGSYQLAGKRTDRSFTLEVKQDGKRAHVSFSAAMANGAGAAPDADGTGKIEHGVLAFKFKDSFNNEGTCKLHLQPSSETYTLDMVVTKVVEASPLHFYGTLQLKKVSSLPISP